MKYTETSLWNNSLGNEKYDNDILRKKLIEVFENSRSNASYLLNKIRNDFPNLTCHDITHVDGLWNVGSVIVGEKYRINPLEGFVLGCAFLMHDAALSYDAVGGKELLRQTIEWKDYYQDYKDNELLSEEEKVKETDFKTIRFIHARCAEKLYCQSFIRDDGSEFFIIENESIRKHLGEIICKIAGSHHWDIDDLEKLGTQFTVPSEYPREWCINPIKLACILRCSDAGHIDSGRAPDYLYNLLEINGVSRDHWTAQNRLSQIDIDQNDNEKVIIRSNIKFKEEDFAAWNVASDAVCVLEEEINNSNDILKKNNIDTFQIKGVSGSKSQEELSKYIETEGWLPCDAVIHISDVEELIQNLGGEKLYGPEHHLEIVLRELIQNSRDAIVARRKKEVGFEGRIDISVRKNEGNTTVTVEDNGVGMSLTTIKNYLLNFGRSFWSSDLAKMEYPGLNSSGFKSVGQFGIGFYSVFMIASKVRVETRKYDEGLDDNVVLKFPNGISLHPILSKKRSETTQCSTKVEVVLDSDKCEWNKIKEIEPHIVGESSFEVPYSAVLSNLTTGLDVDVYYSELEGESKCVHKNIENLVLGTKEVADWLKDITYARYRDESAYSEYIDDNYKRLRPLNGDRNNGIAALNTMWQSNNPFFGIRTVGGLSTYGVTNGSNEYLGYINEKPATAERKGGINSVDKVKWGKEQYNLLSEKNLTTLDKLRLPYVLSEYEVDMTDIMMVRVYGKNTKEQIGLLKDVLFFLKEKRIKLIFPLACFGNNDRIENHLNYDRTLKMISGDELLFIAEDNTGFLSIKDDNPYNIIWCIKEIGKRYSLSINYRIEKEKAFSFFGVCDAMTVIVE